MFLRLLNVIVLLAAGAVIAPAAIVRGVVADAGGDPLPQATVRLLKANSDSTFVMATATDANGRFKLDDVSARGRFIVQASYVGHRDAFANLQMRGRNATLDTLILFEATNMLREVAVIGVATPIKAMEDTLEYNASSYTTPPNAVVADLLKRLPGVEVESDGTIKAQGETVKKILIDGEEFFSDDPKVASKNIPVAMVKKAQVITRRSDLARLTGVDDGEDETVINLTVKEDMKKGWYGKAAVGYGAGFNSGSAADWNKYKGAFMLNGMWDKNTVTILGNFNNVNDEGFTDGNGGRFRRFGGNRGINTTQSVGVNFNLGSKILRWGGSVFYNHNDRQNASKSHRLNLFQDGKNTQDDTQSASRDQGHNVNARLRMKWEPDTLNTLDFRPNFRININESSQNSFNVNYLTDPSRPTTNSRNIAASHGMSYSFGGRLIYNHKFASRPGRSFSVSANYSLTNTREDEEVWSRNAYWHDSDSLYEDYQLINNHTWNNSVNARVSWNEPLGNVKNGNFLQISYQMNYRWNNADKEVYNNPLTNTQLTPEQQAELATWREMNWLTWGDWTLADRWAGADADLAYDPVNSNSFRNNYFNQHLRVSYRKVNKNYNFNLGVGFQPQMSRSLNLTNPDKTIPTRWVWNVAPFARFRYKFSKQTNMNVFYNGRSSKPSMTQLQPVADTSDPMNIVIGNPALNPSFAHNARIRFSTFSPLQQQSFMIMAFGGFTQNAIASNIVTDRQTGARVTTYENVNGNWNFGAFTLFSRPFANKAWTFSNNLHFNFRQTIGFTNGARNRSQTTQASESFAIAYRPNDLELELRPRYSIRYTTNSLANVNNTTVHTYGGTFNATWYTPFGLVLSSDLTYAANSGYSQGYDTQEWMLNASLSYMFLRGKNATIALEGKDLLNQQKAIYRSETAQAITDSENMILGRYAMLTFTYNFSTFAGGKTPDMDDDFRPGPPGSGMRRGPGMRHH